MSILYVDLEHRRVLADPGTADVHRRKLRLARTRLEQAAGDTCRVVRFEDVTLDGILAETPSALVISGNTADWGDYDFAELAGLLDVIRSAPAPILGICGGHQLIGHAHGAPWRSLGALASGAIDPDPRFAPGLQKERGFLPMDVVRTHPLFQGLGDPPVVFQSHYWHLTAVPVGFTVCASSPDSPIQAIARRDRPVFGIQFHAERYDDVHRDGETVLRNFFAIARAHPAQHVAEHAAT